MRRKLLIPVISSLFFSQGLFAEEITLFYTNDLHAHVNPWINTVVDKSRPVGGFATIAGIVNQAKKMIKMFSSLMPEITLQGHILVY